MRHQSRLGEGSGATRRAVLALGGGALAIAGLAALDGGAALAAKSKDADYLNFLLNLKYLQAEFYLAATSQAALGAEDTAGSGTPGKTGARWATNETMLKIARARPITR